MVYLWISYSFVLPKTNNSNGAVVNNLFGTKTMKRLSLEELKTNSTKQIINLEAIKGGAEEYCHNGYGKPSREMPIDNTRVIKH